MAHINYLLSVRQYLWCSAYVLKLPADSSDPEAHGVISRDTRMVLLVLQDVLGRLSQKRGPQEGLQHGYHDYLLLLRDILQTLNDNHAVFSPLIPLQSDTKRPIIHIYAAAVEQLLEQSMTERKSTATIMGRPPSKKETQLVAHDFKSAIVDFYFKSLGYADGSFSTDNDLISILHSLLDAAHPKCPSDPPQL